MRRPRLLALLILAVLAAVAVPAHAIFKPKTVSGQMDSQPGSEQVTAVEIPDPSHPSDHDLSQVAVDVVKNCPSGPTEQRIAGPQEALVTLRLVKADTRPGKEAFVDMRSGASGRFGELRVVSLRRGPVAGPNCEVPHNDFLYKSTRPTRHPRGASTLTDFELTIRNFSRRYHGLELRLLEGWAKPTDALCCPSLEKKTFYRYDRKRDRYVRYASKVSHTRRH